jgi:hypothetical protein
VVLGFEDPPNQSNAELDWAVLHKIEEFSAATAAERKAAVTWGQDSY